MKILAGTALVLSLCAAAFGDLTFDEPHFGSKVVPNHVVVSFKRTPSYSEFRSICQPYGDYVYSAPSLGFYTIGIGNGMSPAAVIAQLKQNSLIATAENEYYCEPCFIPNDYHWADQWDKVKMNCPQAWDYTLGSADTLIAFTDSGYRTNGVDNTVTDHEDLIGQFVPSWNVYSNNNNIKDDIGHGTKVAGYAAAKFNNTVGIAGMAPNCRYLMVKINSGQNGTDTTIANGIQYAIDHGARVISTSWISSFDTAVMKTAAANAIAAGCILCAAAGNNNNQAKTYPGAYPSVLSVALTNDTDGRGWMSSYGSWVALCAPGQNVWSCDWTAATGEDVAYSYGTGTSYASPQVAAESGLVYGLIADSGQRTKALADEVRSIVQKWVVPVNFTLVTGGGRIDVGSAVLNTYVTITGVITPNTYSVSIAGLHFDVQLRDPATSNVIQTRTVTLDAAGNFKAMFTKTGTYNVAVTGGHWLTAGVTNQALVRGSQALNFSLINGDANDDDSVDLYDLAAELGDFGLASSLDLDGNGMIDLSDLNITLLNFGTAGF